MSHRDIAGKHSLGLLLKLLLGAGLLVIIVIAVAVPGLMDLPRAAYNYSRRSPLTVIWNGMEFKLPPPWFRLSDKQQVAGTVTFLRDQFRRADHEFSSITFKPPFSDDFAQNREQGLRRWEQVNNSTWSIPGQYPKVINYDYSKTHSATKEFRCANTVLQMARGEVLVKIECIETGAGWRFDYDGQQGDVPEAMSILEHGF